VSAESVVLIGLPGAATDELVGLLSAAISSGSVGGYQKVEVVEIDGVDDLAFRRRVRQDAVVWLDGADATLASRGAGIDVAQLASLRSKSLRGLTTAADLIVDIDDGPPQTIIKAVVDGLGTSAVRNRERVLTETVAFDDGRSYQIHIGRGAIGRLAAVLPERVERVAVITQPGKPMQNGSIERFIGKQPVHVSWQILSRHVLAPDGVAFFQGVGKVQIPYPVRARR